MTTVTEQQRQLGDLMISAMPDKVKLLDVVTAGALFLANAIMQSPKCTVDFEEAFLIIATATAKLINGMPLDEPFDEKGGEQ